MMSAQLDIRYTPQRVDLVEVLLHARLLAVVEPKFQVGQHQLDRDRPSQGFDGGKIIFDRRTRPMPPCRFESA